MNQSYSTDDLSFLTENYKEITEKIAASAVKSGRNPSDVRLMAVTKTVSPAHINHMISLGVGLIGENKVQELLGKLEFLTTDKTDIHIIGHLQSNKVRKIINTVSMIQSVDSISLIDEISRQAVNNNKTMDILLEVNIDSEDSKTGLSAESLIETAFRAAETKGIILKGLMSIPPICEDEKTARMYFEKTRRLYEDMKSALGGRADISVLSMGMSSDFEAAILEGSNLVRVGSSLFGARRY